MNRPGKAHTVLSEAPLDRFTPTCRAGLALLAGLLWIGVAHGQAVPERVQPGQYPEAFLAAPWLADRMTDDAPLDEVVHWAHLIVRGRVTRASVWYPAEHSDTVHRTVLEVAVDRVISGAWADDSLLLRIPGGVLPDGQVRTVAGQPRPPGVGDDVLLLLKRKDDLLNLADGSSGILYAAGEDCRVPVATDARGHLLSLTARGPVAATDLSARRGVPTDPASCEAGVPLSAVEAWVADRAARRSRRATLPEAVQHADLIVRGAIVARREHAKALPWPGWEVYTTDVQVRVDSVIKGDWPTDSLVYTLRGRDGVYSAGSPRIPDLAEDALLLFRVDGQALAPVDPVYGYLFPAPGCGGTPSVINGNGDTVTRLHPGDRDARVDRGECHPLLPFDDLLAWIRAGDRRRGTLRR